LFNHLRSKEFSDLIWAIAGTGFTTGRAIIGLFATLDIGWDDEGFVCVVAKLCFKLFLLKRENYYQENIWATWLSILPCRYFLSIPKWGHWWWWWWWVVTMMTVSAINHSKDISTYFYLHSHCSWRVKKNHFGKISPKCIGEGKVVCLSITSNFYLSFKAGELIFCIQTPYINAKKANTQIFEILSRSRDMEIFLDILRVARPEKWPYISCHFFTK